MTCVPREDKLTAASINHVEQDGGGVVHCAHGGRGAGGHKSGQLKVGQRPPIPNTAITGAGTVTDPDTFSATKELVL
jgi:hypothetical protein